MTIGLLWVVLAAVLFGAGSLGQAAAVAERRDRPVLAHPLFLAGTAAEGFGALAHVMALQTVSMAVAQTAVTASLAVTALGARLLWRRRLGTVGIAAIGALAVALAALALVSGDSSGSVALEDTTPAVVALASTTLLLGLVGVTATALRDHHRGLVLALVSGLGFAICSIAVRLLDTSSALAAVTDPALVVLAAAGGIAALAWTLALRHAGVTSVTAIVVVAEVVPPSLLGPWLGDEVAGAFALVAPPALLVAALAGAVLARGERPAPRREVPVVREPVAA